MSQLYSGLLLAIVAGVALTLLPGSHRAWQATAQHAQQHDHPSDNAWERGGVFARALAAGMDRMHREMMAPQPTGNADVDFLATMIPHHAGAVEMARLVLIHGRDPLVRRLAEEIIAGQQAEIAAMEARLAILRKREDPKPDGYPALGGTRGSGG